MLKSCFLVMACIVFLGPAVAQRTWISGVLRDSVTHDPIAGGMVFNQATRQKVSADAHGLFRVKVAPNDLLYLLAPAYHYDTLRYSLLFGDTLTVYLSPTGHMLPGVTIQSQYTQYQVDSIQRRAAYEQIGGHPLPVIENHKTGGFGLTLNLDRFTKNQYRNRKKADKQFERTEEWAYVQYRYSPELVAYYTQLKGDSLREFMYRYTPDYDWLRAHPSNDDVVNYISEKMKAYRKGQKK
ncbi:MAG: hypothetical protein ACXVMS_09975 [Flavisolibacter sp.]